MLEIMNQVMAFGGLWAYHSTINTESMLQLALCYLNSSVVNAFKWQTRCHNFKSYRYSKNRPKTLQRTEGKSEWL